MPLRVSVLFTSGTYSGSVLSINVCNLYDTARLLLYTVRQSLIQGVYIEGSHHAARHTRIVDSDCLHVTTCDQAAIYPGVIFKGLI